MTRMITRANYVPLHIHDWEHERDNFIRSTTGEWGKALAIVRAIFPDCHEVAGCYLCDRERRRISGFMVKDIREIPETDDAVEYACQRAYIAAYWGALAMANLVPR
jgi:hypothetical protein